MNDERDPFDRNPYEEDDELTPADIFWWHVVNVMFAGLLGLIVFMVAGERVWVGILGAVTWIGASIWFARVGGWSRVADGLDFIFTIISWPFRFVGRLLAPVFKVLDPVLAMVFEGIVAVFDGIGRVLLGIWGLLLGLLGVAVVAFFFLGIVGLLLFGIRQLF